MITTEETDMKTSHEDHVEVRRSGSTGVVVLNDPTRRNILTHEMVVAIGAAMDDLESDTAIKAVVVTGAGSAFCAGAELNTLEAAAEGDFGLIRHVYGGFLRVLNSPLVTIGAINGPAVGAGLNLALACDVRLASASAKFVCRFPDLRIFPGGGHTWMLTRAVGHQEATLACLFGEIWDAEHAKANGLVSAVHADGEVVAAAVELADRLGPQDTEYTRRLIAMLRQAPRIADHETAMEAEAEIQEWSTRQQAFLDGLAEIKANIVSRKPRD